MADVCDFKSEVGNRRADGDARVSVRFDGSEGSARVGRRHVATLGREPGALPRCSSARERVGEQHRVTHHERVHGRRHVVAIALRDGLAIGIAITAVISYLVLRAATRLNQYLGATGMNAIARIMGFLLVCIGVQFVINGVLDIVASTRADA